MHTTQQATIKPGTELYSLRNYNSAGFPESVIVRRVDQDDKIITHQGMTIHATDVSVLWTTDWMTSLLAWEGGAQ